MSKNISLKEIGLNLEVIRYRFLEAKNIDHSPKGKHYYFARFSPGPLNLLVKKQTK